MKQTKHTIACLILMACVLASCGTRTQLAPVVNGWQQPTAGRAAYVVQRGDTLYSIAWAYERDYRKLARTNHIPPPYRLHVGQRVSLAKPPSFPRSSVRKPHRSVSYKKNRHKNNSHRRTHHRHYHHVAHWLWPAKGHVVSHFSPKMGHNKGINIAGRYKESVRASAAGEVVYCGSALKGYGRLIIIKHNASYLSAYAFNQRLLVREGQWVRAGERIATMGKNSNHQVMLHFEIRHGGKPINPLHFLK